MNRFRRTTSAHSFSSQSIPQRATWHYLVFAALLFLLISPGIFLRDFWLFNEGRRAIIALEMLQRGDWVVPRLMGTPLITKPPLFYWLEAVAMKGFGPYDWAARIPSLLAGVCGVLLLTRLLGMLFGDHQGKQAAFFGGLCLAMFPVYLWMAQSAEPEMLFVALGLGALVCFARIAFNGQSGLIWKLGFYLLAGLSFKTKGPVMPIVVMLTAGIWAVLMRRADLLKKSLIVPGLILLFAPVLIWGVMLLGRGIHLQDFLNEVSSHFGEEAPHGKRFGYYLSDLKHFIFPWSYPLSLGLLGGLVVLVKKSGGKWRGVLGLIHRYLWWNRGERLFVFVWFIVSLLTLSAIASKRYYYSLILMPPVAALCGLMYYEISKVSPSIRISPRIRNVLIFVGALMLLGTVIAAFLIKDPHEWRAWSGERRISLSVGLSAVGLWIAGSGAILWRQALARVVLRRLMQWTLVVTLLLAQVHQYVIHPFMNRSWSLKIASEEIRKIEPNLNRLFSIFTNETIWFYLRRPDIPRVESIVALRRLLADHPDWLGVVYEKNMDLAGEYGEFTIRYKSRHIMLARSKVYLISATGSDRKSY